MLYFFRRAIMEAQIRQPGCMTRTSQGYYKDVTKTLQGRYKDVTGTLHRRYTDVTRTLLPNIEQI